jgi:hypothetical protein
LTIGGTECRVYRTRPRWMTRFTIPWIALVMLMAAAYAGYALHWRWIGINGRTATLWEWLSLMLLPLAVAAIPAIPHVVRVMPSLRARAVVPVVVAGIGFIWLGYAAPLRWTGFPTHTLWDWLHLVLPPLAVSTLPLLRRRDSRLNRCSAWWAGLAAAVGLATVTVGGYVWGWRWTGFAGNTAWDWLHLLLLPVALPALARPLIAAVINESAATGSRTTEVSAESGSSETRLVA